MNAVITDIPAALVAERDGEYGLGTLLVTDLSALVRPIAGHDPYYRQAAHDVGHFGRIMDLGDWDSYGSPHWYIVTSLPAAKAKALLAEPLRCYFDSYCACKVWIDVQACYIGFDGKVIDRDQFGFSDAGMDGGVTIYTREYLESQSPGGDPAQADWADLLRGITNWDFNDVPILLDQLESRLSGNPNIEPLVIVRPSDTPQGFTARGFNITLP